MPFERFARAHPHWFELFGLICHRCLTFGHAGHQKGHIKALWQIAVSDPVGQHIDLFGGQFHAQSGTLRCKGLASVEQCDVLGGGHSLIGPIGQQDAQFFEALANGSDGLSEVQVALGSAAQSMRMRRSIECVNAAARKNISARCKTGCQRAPCHEHFNALRAVAQQQHSGGGPWQDGFSLGMQKLLRSDHAPIIRPCANLGPNRG